MHLLDGLEYIYSCSKLIHCFHTHFLHYFPDFSEGLLSILEGPEKLTHSKDTSDSQINRNIDLLQQTTTSTPDIIRIRAHMKESTSKIDRLNYHFCCRTDSPSVDSPIDGFPAETGPFYLYR